MIDFLQVRNLALIDQVELHIAKGLTILSGETGAGKSILIDSMNFVLGSRASKDSIRKGADFAFIEMLVTVDNPMVAEKIADLSIEIDESGQLLLSRQINASGKTVAKINDSLVTVSTMKAVGALLVDIHGQHEHQSLMQKQKHRELLDQFCQKEIQATLQALGILLHQKQDLLSELKEWKDDSYLEIDMLNYQIEEIDMAHLHPGEEEVLEGKRQQLLHSEEITKSLYATRGILFGSEQGKDKIQEATGYLGKIALLSDELKISFDSLMDILAQLEEISWQLNSFYEGLPSEDEDIDKIEARLHDIFLLKRKYGHSVEEILLYGEKIRDKVDSYAKRDEKIKELEQSIAAIDIELFDLASHITGEREKAGLLIEKNILSELQDLGMMDSQFQVSITPKDIVDFTGIDLVEFLISTNKGEEVKPLIQVASGGEMSRVMLALKTVLSDFDTIETFIFDEIDAGVSGQAAQKVAEKLSDLSKERQVLCITHLAQIAAMGDNHFLIEKETVDNHTSTAVYPLDITQSVKEIARLTSGQAVTETSLLAAKELKDLAMVYKQMAE